VRRAAQPVGHCRADKTTCQSGDRYVGQHSCSEVLRVPALSYNHKRILISHLAGGNRQRRASAIGLESRDQLSSQMFGADVAGSEQLRRLRS